MTPARCIVCRVAMMPARQWRQLPLAQRPSGMSPHKSLGRCSACDSRERRRYRPREPKPDDLAYTGGWVRQGLVLVPRERRCAE